MSRTAITVKFKKRQFPNEACCWAEKLLTDITLAPLLPDEDKNFGSSLIFMTSRASQEFVICRIESVDPVADLCLTNQIYSVLLNAFEFKEITRNHWGTKNYLKVKGDETWPHGCKYPTLPCTLTKILPDTTVRAYFSQIENDSPTTNIHVHFLHSQQIFFVLVCIRAGNPMVPPGVLASGPKPCGGNKQ